MKQRAHSKSVRRSVLFATLMYYAAAMIVARRRGYTGIGGRTMVRCRSGHLFRTIWIPGLSLKSIRLGWYRVQFCPVGRHWTTVSPVKDDEIHALGVDEAVVPDDISIP